MVLYAAFHDFHQAGAFSQREPYQLHMFEYPPVWLMMIKHRNIIGKSESIYRLSGMLELDEAFRLSYVRA